MPPLLLTTMSPCVRANAPACLLGDVARMPAIRPECGPKAKSNLPRSTSISTGRCKAICRATKDPIHLSQEALDAAVDKGHPIPVVKIDNRADNFATVVTIEFGDQLGELLDTILALKNLKLNIRRAKIRPDQAKGKNKFYITDAVSAEKITKSKRLEEIRMTILQNLLYYHPDAAEELGFGPKARRPVFRDNLHPLGPKARAEVKTVILVEQDPEGAYTQIIIKTSDRPGLLTDIVHELKDINVNVISAEVDTEGPMAVDHFYVTYHGEPLPDPMVLLVTNTLQYQLALAEVGREESY